MTYKVLFVCLGNICRSTMAEAVLNHLLQSQNLSDKVHVDSCGTAGYHIGKLPDPRGLAVMHEHGFDSDHRARLLSTSDFSDFDIIFGMDDSNIYDINLVAKKAEKKGVNLKSKIEKLGCYDPDKVIDVNDPYYGEDEDFEVCYQHVLRCCNHFLDSIRSEL